MGTFIIVGMVLSRSLLIVIHICATWASELNWQNVSPHMYNVQHQWLLWRRCLRVHQDTHMGPSGLYRAQCVATSKTRNVSTTTVHCQASRHVSQHKQQLGFISGFSDIRNYFQSGSQPHENSQYLQLFCNCITVWFAQSVMLTDHNHDGMIMVFLTTIT